MKNLYTILFFSLFATILSGQRMYFNINSGYGFDLAPETFSGGNISYTDPEIKVLSSVNHSFGKGYNFGVATGIHIRENIAFGVEANYLVGAEETLTLEAANFKEERIFSSEMFRFIPQLRLTAPVKKMALYADIGLAIGINPVIHYRKITHVDGEETGRFKTIYANGTAYGIKSSFGLKYHATKNLAFSTEMRIFAQSFAPERRQLLEAFRKGIDVLDLRLTSDIHTVYVDEFTENQTIVQNANLPTTQLKFFFPFSSVGVNVGVEYSFTLAEKIEIEDVLK